MMPEQEMFSAMLIAAIEDFASTGNDRESLHNRNYAARWFMSTDTKPLSFLWVCEALSLDASSVMRQLLQ